MCACIFIEASLLKWWGRELGFAEVERFSISQKLNSPMSTEDSSVGSREAGLDSPVEAAAFYSRSCCFCFPCFGSRRSPAAGQSWWEKVRAAESDGTWWGRSLSSLKKVREWSELAAGPRWKTFIRRFNKTRSGGARHGKFQYDPLSYSLNFDEGTGQAGLSDDDHVYEFSARYAAVAISSRSSMDKDAIAVT